MLSGRILQSAWRVIILGCHVIAGKTIKQWSEESGLSVGLIRRRLRDHYDFKLIFKEKYRNQVKRGSIKNDVERMAVAHGVSKKAIYQRLMRGYKLHEIEQGKKKCSLRQSVELCVRRGEDIKKIVDRFSDYYRPEEIIKCHEEVVFVGYLSKKASISREMIYYYISKGLNREQILKRFLWKNEVDR